MYTHTHNTHLHQIAWATCLPGRQDGPPALQPMRQLGSHWRSQASWSSLFFLPSSSALLEGFGREHNIVSRASRACREDKEVWVELCVKPNRSTDAFKIEIAENPTMLSYRQQAALAWYGQHCSLSVFTRNVAAAVYLPPPQLIRSAALRACSRASFSSKLANMCPPAAETPIVLSGTSVLPMNTLR